MKLGFKKLFSLGAALLFSFNVFNGSFCVKAAEPSSVVERGSAESQREVNGGYVVTKEMLQVMIDQQMQNAKSDKKAIAALILAVFGGPLGLHRFYVGKIGTGLLYLFTAGFLGIGVIIDMIRIAFEDFTDSKGLPVKF